MSDSVEMADAHAPASSTGPRPAEAGQKARPYAWYALGVLMLVYIFNYIDRNILGILTEDIKRDLGVGDAQIGFLYGTSFAIFYALFGLPLGRLADGWYRGRLIALGLGLWSVMTALSGLASNYGQLAAARVGVGVGEASASPAAYSLIADHFPKERRGLALSIYSAGLYIGAGIGLPLGGTIASRWNHAYLHGGAPFGLAGWQAALLMIGLPGVALALWVSTLREPQRGAIDGEPMPAVKPGIWREFGRELMAILPPLTLFNMARYPGGITRNLVLLGAITLLSGVLALLTGDVLQWCTCGFGVYAVGSWSQALRQSDAAAWRLTWGTPAYVMLMLVVGTAAIIDYGVGFWNTAYLLRTFYPAIDAPGRFFTGLTAREEVAYIASISYITNAAGIVFGGWLSDRWRKRDPLGRIRVIIGSIALYVLLRFSLYCVNLFPVFVLFGPIVSFIASIYWAPAIAAMQELVLPRMRASAGAMILFANTMLGQAVGPYVVGKIAAETGSLRHGILVIFVVVPITAWALLKIWRQYQDAETTRFSRAGEGA